MRRFPAKIALLLFGFWLGPTTGNSGTATFVFSDQAGKYPVGFRVVQQYDFSRSYQDKVNEVGKPFQGEVPRPIQTLIWFPARPSTAAPMIYGDYLNLAATQEDFKPSPKQATATVTPVKKEFKADPTAKMRATTGAIPEAGKFPVVIYAPSLGAPAFENTDLCEYLAGHGYIVIASPSLGAHPTGMSKDIEGIEAQAHDISFLIGFARTIPEADCSEVAVAGYSWGGIANFFAAAEDSRITALIALDGSIRYFPKLVRDSTYVHPASFTIPILYFTQKEFSLETIVQEKFDTSGDVLNDLVQSQLWIIRMREMRHETFSSANQRSPAADWFSDEITPEVVATSYSWMARYTLEFLNGYLKRDQTGLAFLKNPAIKNGVPPFLMEVEDHPPTSNESERYH